MPAGLCRFCTGGIQYDLFLSRRSLQSNGDKLNLLRYTRRGSPSSFAESLYRQNLEGILGDEIYPLSINSPEAILLQRLGSLQALKVGQAQLIVSL